MRDVRAKTGRSGKEDKHAAVMAMQASMRSVIVLEAPKKPDRQLCYRRGSNAKDSGVEVESSDPAVLRRIVRRQAALASANTRKATIAVRAKNPEGTRSACAPAPTSKKPGQSIWRDLMDRTGLQKIDPFAQLPIDFDIIRDPNSLHMLFDFFMTVITPLLDIRLPTMADRAAGVKFLWSEELPYCVLRSPSCFWAMMLAANSHWENVRAADASTDALTLTFRHMTIKSINLRLPQMDENCPDWGLMGSIAILGSWEKFHGNEAAWKAHRDGMKVFSQLLRDEHLRTEVFAQILSFVDYDDACTPDLSGLGHWQNGVASGGFARLAHLTYINANLIISLRNCRAADLAQTEEIREQYLASATTGILHFAIRHIIGEVLTMDPGRDLEGDRQILTVHVIMQMAGTAMAHFLATGRKIPFVLAQIDVSGMCQDAVSLVSSVMPSQIFDEVLFWAVFTIGSLMTGENVEPLVSIGRELSGRLKQEGPLEWQPLLRDFVFLDSAGAQYERFQNRVENYNESTHGNDQGLHAQRSRSMPSHA